jgi:Asp-tRNA(Asn)/Glu-tRNA(Gln) amidotransferase A subunit family amidase
MNSSDLCYMPAVEAARAIRRKELSPVELTRAVLARIERLNPTLNAFCTVTAESAWPSALSNGGRGLRRQEGDRGARRRPRLRSREDTASAAVSAEAGRRA